MRPVRRLLTLLLILLAASPALAVESEAVRSPRAAVSVVAADREVAAGAPVRLGLRIVLAPGWHTYWRNPGDAGGAPEVRAAAPEGAEAGPIAWPAPERIPYGPLVSFGYRDEVFLPFAVSVPRLAAGERLPLEIEANWLVCADVCIPEEGRFRLDLPVGAAAEPDPAEAALFAAAAQAAPRPAPWRAEASMSARGGALVVEGPGLGRAAIRDAFFFPDTPNLLENAAVQAVTVSEGRLSLRLTPAGPVPPRLSGVLVITDQGGQRAAFSLEAPVGAAGGAPLWKAALLAFAGGLLLNLMPCVFPVLAMKAMALARLSGAARATVRGHALAYTIGVLACFALLGGALIALRGAGTAAGWGFQFTSPAFVAAMAWLMLAVGLNLSGVYAIGRGAGIGQGLAARGGPLGSFATGALAVLVATPCTAPFMATAIGAGLSMPAAGAMAVFLALGLGLAAPYAALAVAPGLAALLPRPGAWMERLRQALAFPMYGAAAWLAWVVAQQAGPDGVLAVLAGGVLLGFAAWAYGAAQQRGGARLGMAAALVAAIGAAALLPRIVSAPAEAAPGEESYSEAKLAALRAEGRPVFVNATAAWCITCQVNERVALRASAVRDAFAARNIAYLRADWTQGDPAVGALLRAQGREGVPLYLLYPVSGEPSTLPQILTEGIVLRAVAEMP